MGVSSKSLAETPTPLSICSLQNGLRGLTVAGFVPHRSNKFIDQVVTWGTVGLGTKARVSSRFSPFV